MVVEFLRYSKVSQQEFTTINKFFDRHLPQFKLEPKIFITINEYVLKFNIPMYYFPSMQVIDSIIDLFHYKFSLLLLDYVKVDKQ